MDERGPADAERSGLLVCARGGALVPGVQMALLLSREHVGGGRVKGWRGRRVSWRVSWEGFLERDGGSVGVKDAWTVRMVAAPTGAPFCSGEFLFFGKPSFVVRIDHVFFSLCAGAHGGGSGCEGRIDVCRSPGRIVGECESRVVGVVVPTTYEVVVGHGGQGGCRCFQVWFRAVAAVELCDAKEDAAFETRNEVCGREVGSSRMDPGLCAFEEDASPNGCDKLTTG